MHRGRRKGRLAGIAHICDFSGALRCPGTPLPRSAGGLRVLGPAGPRTARRPSLPYGLQVGEGVEEIAALPACGMDSGSQRGDSACALRCARAARDLLAQPDDPRNLLGLVVRGAVSGILTGCLRDGRRGMRGSAGPTGEFPGSRCSRSARREAEFPNWAHSSSVSGEAAASGIAQAKSPAFNPDPAGLATPEPAPCGPPSPRTPIPPPRGRRGAPSSRSSR